MNSQKQKKKIQFFNSKLVCRLGASAVINMTSSLINFNVDILEFFFQKENKFFFLYMPKKIHTSLSSDIP